MRKVYRVSAIVRAKKKQLKRFLKKKKQASLFAKEFPEVPEWYIIAEIWWYIYVRELTIILVYLQWSVFRYENGWLFNVKLFSLAPHVVGF